MITDLGNHFIPSPFCCSTLPAGTTTKDWDGDTGNFIIPKQCHSDRVVIYPTDFNLGIPEADAVITQETNTVIAIRTADCLPILINDPTSHYIAVVHAGWRGVANNIVSKTIDALINLQVSSQSLQIWVGPHIQFASFEFLLIEAEQLLHDIPSSQYQNYIQHISKDKCKINLFALVASQCARYGIQAINSLVDTYTNQELCYSYRRGDRLSRQYSFIYQLT